MKRCSISLPKELDDAIDDRRASRVSRSKWLQDAARVRLHLEKLDGFEELLEQAETNGQLHKHTQ